MGSEKENNKHLLGQMLEAEKQIKQAISEFSNQEQIFEDVCQEIQSSFGFDFALIALVNPEKNIIETVYETGSVANISIKCKDYLQPKPDIRNIRADIVKTHRTEIISGWDTRFDKWIYEENRLEEFIHVFTPIILVRDKNGNIIKDWFENCEWKVVTEEQTDNGYCNVIEMHLSVQENQILGNIQVLGLLHAGYASWRKEITPDQAIALAKFVAQKSLIINRTQLSYILEVVAENAQNFLKADVAAVDFMYDSEQQRYVYQVVTGNIAENFWENFASRKQALGEQALKEGKTIFVTNPQQDYLNNLVKLFGKKSKAMAAFPLLIDNKKGVLYLEFNDERELSEDEIFLFNLFAYRASSAIWHATNKLDENAKKTQLDNLYLFTKSLINETEKDILVRRSTWSIANILGADVVVFNEYLLADNKFLRPLEIAGRLIQEEHQYPELNQNYRSLMLIKHGTNIYDSSLNSSEIFHNSDLVKRENLKSIASILLKVGEETVGVMFINYRRVYNKIVQRAVEKTEADFGSIRLLLQNNQELDTKAFYPDNTTRKVLQRTSITEGITGWVALNRESTRVNDVQKDTRYIGDKDNVRSELCVPLLDKQERLIGVLNVESNKVNAFDPKDLRLLEQLADLAVIAIQNATKQEQLAKAEVMAALGDIKSFASEILLIAEQVLEYSQRMRSWMRDKPQVLNLEEIIQKTLLQIQIPQNIDQNLNLDSDLYQVCAGKQQLINVFDNLIQNAINAMSDGGKLFIQGSNFKTNTNKWIKVCISDTGVGIAEENLQKIYEPGYSTKDSRKNMGFGLWWTKFYIERLKGHLEVESEVGKGTKFTIWLLAYKEEAE